MKKQIPQWKRAILHIDADAFFASVEEVLNPKLKGKPVIVGGDRFARGVVSSANYEARKFGVRSAMSMREALQRCPQGIVVCSGMGNYGDFSRRMFEVCSKYTPQIEVTSIDEGYLDLSGTEGMHGMGARDISKLILCEINRSLGISVSGGLGSSKTVAKIASGLNKPHALTTVLPGKEKEFLAPLPLGKMPGVGPKTLLGMQNFELKTIGDLAGLSFESVYRLFGAGGVGLWKKANGIDERPVAEEEADRKSISKENTFSSDQGDPQNVLKTLKMLSEKVLYRLRRQGFKAHVLNLKIRYADFKTYTFSKALTEPMDLDFEIFPIARKLFLEKIDLKRPVRLVGFGVSDLRREYNLSIFTAPESARKRLFELGDKLKDKYGAKIIEYGIE